METRLSIQEISQRTGLSVHTLRYYERIGLTESVGRAPNGHRRYSEGDLERIRFLSCLRATGMPIRRLREFAALVDEGAATVEAREALLESHKLEVRSRITELEDSLKVIEGKIQRYRGGLR